MLPILAGLMIGVGGIINLTLGGIAGAIFFSLGLLTILIFKFDLFTGKAGLLTTQEITPRKLLEIWIGNFVGTFLAAGAMLMTPRGVELSNKAHEIIITRMANGSVANLVLGIMCGLLMYIAVKAFAMTSNPIYAIMPVAVFILAGFNHCVADMFYCHIGAYDLTQYSHLISTTAGNIIGCNLIPLALRAEYPR